MDSTGPDIARVGCGIVLAVSFWIVCWITSAYLIGRVTWALMIGERCQGAPAETVCGFEALVWALVIAVVPATALTIGIRSRFWK